MGNNIKNTFKGMLGISLGHEIGNILPYRLKSAHSVYGGFAKLMAKEARQQGVNIPESFREDEIVYVMELGPGVLRDWTSSIIFEAAFERIPAGNTLPKEIVSLKEEYSSCCGRMIELNITAYACAVQILKEHGGCVERGEGDEEGLSVIIPVVDQDSVELVINRASLNEDDKIVIKGYGYYTQVDYDWKCDTDLGMDILEFILLHSNR